ncbi:putative membrane protein YfcA [Agrobacterium tumefaciens]|uniref:Probable membrane transporter protein n=1 Tax=Agrobacterium radiobacter TaxID=362 RepID=A0ABR6J4Q8_AGRRD|nr:putative membrane protein YfcA [Agrobacterium radiobacter]MBB4317997.1 putative membrane protein YfcA [Agrobacterium radiobacter]MBB4323268.1 putative membrane protein YfcA [Agrobacterium radiobacter]MBB4333981.1 putative membrane protein YfcA [Agrobacterium radiobacter]MBB4455541.1 putative membrane protein YfcA [Agrobacterium radiobacter]
MSHLDFFSSLITAHSPTLLAMFAGAAFLAGLARGFSGFGAALIFIPLASAIVGPRVASAVLLVVDGVLTLGMIPPAFRMADRREVFIMAAGAFVGIPVGTLLLSKGDPLTLRWLISGVVVVLLLFLVSGWRYSGRPKTPLTPLYRTSGRAVFGRCATGRSARRRLLAGRSAERRFRARQCHSLFRGFHGVFHRQLFCRRPVHR